MEFLSTLRALQDRIRENKRQAAVMLTALPKHLHQLEREAGYESSQLLTVTTGPTGSVRVSPYVGGYDYIYVQAEITKTGLLVIVSSEDDEDCPAESQVARNYDPNLVSDEDFALVMLEALEGIMEEYIEDLDKVTRYTESTCGGREE